MNFILFLSNLQKLSGIYGIGRCGLRNYLQEHVNVIHVILIVHVHCQEKRGREGGREVNRMRCLLYVDGVTVHIFIFRRTLIFTSEGFRKRDQSLTCLLPVQATPLPVTMPTRRPHPPPR